MRKGSDIIGKPIVAYDSGDRFSRVKDLIFDQDSNQLLALLISEGGWFSDTLVIPFQGIQAIGSDAVIVPSEDAVMRAKQLPEVKQILGHNNILRGTHIMTTDGRDLGGMVDLYFDEQTGVIEGYEVSGGLFADAYSGRSFVPAPHTLKIGQHVAFVPSEVADLMEEQVGGIKAAVLTAGEKVQTVAQTAGDRLQVTAQEAGHRLQEAQRSAALSVTNAVVAPAEQKAFALGKTAQEDVLASDGSVLVPAGQSITFLDVERAEELAVLDRLYKAAGGDIRQRANERLQVVAQDTGSRLQLATQSAGDRIQSATELASQRLQDSRRSAAVSLTNAVISPTEQKAFVVGKIAERTVATAENVVVATGGQSITPSIADNAEQLGVLDELYRATGGRIRDQLALRADSRAAGYVVEEARGHRVQQTIRARSGFIVAASGQIVTDTVIERAKIYHVERELLNAVGLSTSVAIQGRASGTASSMSDRFNSTTGLASSQLAQSSAQVKLGASNLWTQVKQTANAWQERSARTLEEQRIKGALGRPVTRVILDQSDEVILNVGELVTHQALDAARSAGVLDVLLGSVYTQSPQFSKAEMSAPEPGKASLTAPVQISAKS
jgi:uncharacterized protein YrrD